MRVERSGSIIVQITASGVLGFPNTTKCCRGTNSGIPFKHCRQHEVQLQSFVTGTSVVPVQWPFRACSVTSRTHLRLLGAPVAYRNFQDFFSEWLAVLRELEQPLSSAQELRFIPGHLQMHVQDVWH